MQKKESTIKHWRILGYDAASGNKKVEIIAAESQAEAERAARTNGMIGVKSAKESKVQNLLAANIGGKAKPTDVVTALRSISTAFDAGLAPLRAVQSAHETASSKSAVKEALGDIAGRVRAGEEFHVAFAHHEKIFGKSTAATIKAGTSSGKLREALKSLANSTERTHRIRGKIKSAMVYPAIIIGMVLCAFVVGVLYLIPKLEATLRQLDGELPVLTQTLLDASIYIRTYPIQIIIASIAFVSIYKIVMAQDVVRLMKSQIALKLPISGKVVSGLNNAALCDIAGVLLGAGVTSNNVMALGASTLKNRHLAQALEAVAPRIKSGDTLDAALKKSTPPLDPMLETLAQQSTSGIDNPGEPWLRYADIQLEQTERLAGTLTEALQPLILVFVGALVLILGAAIYLPILSVYQAY